MSISIKETAWAKRRESKTGNGTYDSGFIMLSNLEMLVTAAKNAGLDAVGINPKYLKTAKFEGTVVEIAPFKLKAK